MPKGTPVLCEAPGWAGPATPPGSASRASVTFSASGAWGAQPFGAPSLPHFGGTPRGASAWLGPSLPPPAWVWPQGLASPVGRAQTGQRVHPRSAGDVLAWPLGMWAAEPSGSGDPGRVSFQRAHQAGASLLQAGVPPPRCQTEENGASWGRGRSSARHMPWPALRPALGGEGLPGACPMSCLLLMAGSRASRHCGKAWSAPRPRLPGSALSPSKYSSTSPKLKA